MRSANAGGGMDAATIEIAGRRLDFATGDLTADGRTVRLTPKVCDILRVLAAHPGRVFSKDELLAAVWPDTTVGDDALWRCISELRTAFDDDAESPQVIETLPRRGYRLIAPIREAPGAASDSPREMERSVPAAVAPSWRRRLGRLAIPLILFAALAVVLWPERGNGPEAPAEPPPAPVDPFAGWTAATEGAAAWRGPLATAREVAAGGATARLEDGFTAAGLEALARAAAGSSNLVEAIETASRALHSRGRLDAALDGYEAVLAEDPERVEVAALLNDVRARLAAVAARLEAQRAAIVAAPDDPGPWIELGRSHRLLAERDPATRQLAEALRLDPGNLQATVEMARTHLTLGSRDEGWRIVRRGLRLQPEAPPLLRLAAEIELLDGGAPQVVALLDRACLAGGGESAEPPLLCWLD